MKMHEPRLLPVCCNCLGPVAVEVPITVSGMEGFFDHTFFRLLIPMCSECHIRMCQRQFALRLRVAIALVLGTFAICIALSMAFDRPPPSHIGYMIPSRVFFAILSLCFFALLVAVLWKVITRPSAAVKVIQANSAGDWMEVQFGNAEYARLVDELNRMKPDSGPHRNEVADWKATTHNGMHEV
jgi:hypothetical protein